MRNLARSQETQVARKTVDILFIYDLAKVKKRRKSKQIFETKFDRNVVYCDSRLEDRRYKNKYVDSRNLGAVSYICDKNESYSLCRVFLRVYMSTKQR